MATDEMQNPKNQELLIGVKCDPLLCQILRDIERNVGFRLNLSQFSRKKEELIDTIPFPQILLSL